MRVSSLLAPNTPCPLCTHLSPEIRLVCKAWKRVFDNDPCCTLRRQAYRNLRDKKFRQVVTPFYPQEQAWSHMQFFPWRPDIDISTLCVQVFIFAGLEVWPKFFDFPLDETRVVMPSKPLERYCDFFYRKQEYNSSTNVKTCIYRETLYESSLTGIQLFKCKKEPGWQPSYTKLEKLYEFACPGLLDFIVLPNFLIVSVDGVLKVYDRTTFKHLYDIDDHHYTYFGVASKGARIHAHSRQGWVLLDFGVTPLPKSHSHAW